MVCHMKSKNNHKNKKQAGEGMPPRPPALPHLQVVTLLLHPFWVSTCKFAHFYSLFSSSLKLSQPTDEVHLNAAVCSLRGL